MFLLHNCLPLTNLSQVCFADVCMETCQDGNECSSSTDVCVNGICRDSCSDGW